LEPSCELIDCDLAWGKAKGTVETFRFLASTDPKM
jgi:hypothetical protein